MVCCYSLLSVLWLPLSVSLWYDFGRFLQKGVSHFIKVDVYKMAVLLTAVLVDEYRGKGDFIPFV